MIDLTEVMTFSEAAEKWGFCDGNTLRKAVERQKFQIHEIRKSGNVWLTTYDAMVRVFGQPVHVEYTISYAQIIKIAARCLRGQSDFRTEIHDIYKQSIAVLKKHGQIAVVESGEHPNMIARIITSEEDLDTWLHVFEYRVSKK